MPLYFLVSFNNGIVHKEYDSLSIDTLALFESLDFTSLNKSKAKRATFIVFYFFLGWMLLVTPLFILQIKKNVFGINKLREDDRVKPDLEDIELQMVRKAKTTKNDVFQLEEGSIEKAMLGTTDSTFSKSAKLGIDTANYDSARDTLCSTSRSLLTRP